MQRLENRKGIGIGKVGLESKQVGRNASKKGKLESYEQACLKTL